DRTHGQLLVRALWDPLAAPLVPLNAADVAALDLALPDEAGFWTDQETTPGQVADVIAMSSRAWWGPSRSGEFRVRQLTAPAEATRRQALYGTRRDPFLITVELNSETQLLDIGNLISVVHPRYGLAAGALFWILGVEDFPETNLLDLTIWK